MEVFRYNMKSPSPLKDQFLRRNDQMHSEQRSPRKPDGSKGFKWPGGIKSCGRGKRLQPMQNLTRAPQKPRHENQVLTEDSLGNHIMDGISNGDTNYHMDHDDKDRTIGELQRYSLRLLTGLQ